MTHVPSVASCRFCTAVSSSIYTARCCASEIVGLNEGGRVQPVGVRDGANVQSDGAADGKRVGEGVGMGVRWLGHGDGTAVGFDVGDGVVVDNTITFEYNRSTVSISTVLLTVPLKSAQG